MKIKNSGLRMCWVWAFSLASSVVPAQCATYYVSPTGGSGNGLSEATAVKWQIASDRANADPTTNDTIIFLPGRYDRTNVGATGRNDTLIAVPTNVTIKAKNRAHEIADASQRSVLVGIFNSSNMKVPQYNYILVAGDQGRKENIVIDGFEIDGSLINADTPEGRSVANGIFLKNDCRHVQVNGNVVHDAGGGGIATYNSNVGNSPISPGAPGGADYITFSANRIYNCCFWAEGDPSGISMLGNSNTGPSDESPLTVHNFIQRNCLYGNIAKYTSKGHTDGNGIIIDLHGGYPGAPVIAGAKYAARTLIENNVVYNNGGRGIHVFKSSNVLVRNNTCYQNLVDTAYTNEGELSAYNAKDVRFVNNVVYADGTNRALSAAGSLENIVFRANSYGNGAVYFGAGSTQKGNISGLTTSCFVNVATFDLRSRVLPNYTVAAQKIIDVAVPLTNSVPNNNDCSSTDFYGMARPADGLFDRGAFETSVTTGPGALPLATSVCTG